MTTPLTGDTWGDVIEPVREHLSAESKLSFAELRPKFEAAYQGLVASVEGVSDSQAAFRSGSGEGEEAWAIVEALRHIASIEEIMTERIRALGRGDDLALKPTYPGYMEDVETRSLTRLRETIADSHASLLAAIAAVEGHERLDTVDAHRRFGELNCRGWLAMHTLHLADHTRQIERIKTMPGFAKA